MIAFLVVVAAGGAGICAVAACDVWHRLKRRIANTEERMEYLCDRIERMERKT